MENILSEAKILIIGKDPDLKILLENLSQLGSKVISLQTGEEAINLIRRNEISPNIIILDILLPLAENTFSHEFQSNKEKNIFPFYVDSYEICTYLKKENKTKDVPIIFISPLNDIENKLKAFQLGAIDYIIKPFQKEEVIIRIKNHLNTKKLQEELVCKNRSLENEVELYKKSTQDLQVACQSAEKSSEAKGTLMAHTIHEIRNLMNVFIGIGQMLIQMSLDTTLKQYVNIMMCSSEMLMRLINDILDLSKLEAGKFELCTTEFSLPKTVEQVVQMLTPKAQQKKLQILWNIQENLPESWLGDAVRLKQILLNLVGNAIKFTPSGKIEIVVYKLDRVGKKTTLKFCIRDTGIGIGEEYQKKLFRPFSQINSPVNNNEGTGLGLAISKRLVEIMGGTMGVESNLHQGSIFWFSIVLENNLKYQPQRNSDTNRYLQDLIRYNLKILLVEDDIINQKIALIILKNLSLTADIANNGQEALEILKKNDYDIILMDVIMPEMSGVELTKMIRSGKSEVKNPNIPIIAITANTMTEDRERYFKVGMNDYISKPISLYELRQALFRQAEQYLNQTKTIGIKKNYDKSASNLNSSIFNYQKFLDRMGGDNDLCQSILADVPENLILDFQKLQENFFKKDIKAITEQAHAIKGMTANISAERIHEISAEIEIAGKNNNFAEISHLMIKLEENVQEFLKTLQEHLIQPKSSSS